LSRASRDKILGWTESGARRLLLEVQRAWACREGARREPFGGLDVRAKMGGVPRVNATLDRHTPDTRATRRRGRRHRRHAVSVRADGRATWGEDTVMAPASVAERGRPRGSRFPFDTEDSASAEGRRRPVAALACWAPARWEPGAGRSGALGPDGVGDGRWDSRSRSSAPSCTRAEVHAGGSAGETRRRRA